MTTAPAWKVWADHLVSAHGWTQRDADRNSARTAATDHAHRYPECRWEATR